MTMAMLDALDRVAALRALRWRFGAGGAYVMPRALVPVTMGMLGERGTKHIMSSGNSSHTPPTPDEDRIRRFGHIDRALIQLSDEHWLTLALAHGDAGAVATMGGLYPSRRWRAVAPITQAAAERGAAWVAVVDAEPLAARPLTSTRESPDAESPELRQRRRDLRAGPPAWRWLQWAWDAGATPKPSAEDRRALARAEHEAVQMLAGAEDAFACIYRPTAEDRR